MNKIKQSGGKKTGNAGSGSIFDHVVSSSLPTRHGEFRIYVYQPVGETVEHVAMVKGEINGQERVLVDRKSTRLNSSHIQKSRMPSSA